MGNNRELIDRAISKSRNIIGQLEVVKDDAKVVSNYRMSMFLNDFLHDVEFHERHIVNVREMLSENKGVKWMRAYRHRTDTQPETGACHAFIHGQVESICGLVKRPDTGFEAAGSKCLQCESRMEKERCLITR